jgi:hypothetical protein
LTTAFLQITTTAVAQQKCTTTLECAQRAVESAASLDGSIKALAARLDQLENLTKTLGGGRVLAIAVVKKSNLDIEHSSEGVSFNEKIGVITFPNPRNLKYVPVVSEALENNTQVNRVKDIGQNFFTIVSSSSDTSARLMDAHDFVVAVIGFEKLN